MGALPGPRQWSDPHPEYWGAVGDYDQALVEMAAIGLRWRSHQASGSRLTRGFKPTWGGGCQINKVKLHDNNWLFFSVLVNLGLARWCRARCGHHAGDRDDAFYLGDGWA